jgi:hypothetical protein
MPVGGAHEETLEQALRSSPAKASGGDRIEGDGK